MGASKHAVGMCARLWQGRSTTHSGSWQKWVQLRVCVQRGHMWRGGDTHNLPVHPVGLLQGSDPLHKLRSFSSCPFVGGEPGNGGSLVLDSPTASTSQKRLHMCVWFFLQPVAHEGGRESIRRKTRTVCSWSHCWKFGVPWKKRMMAMRGKAQCWLVWVSCLCPTRTEMEGEREMDLVTECRVGQID